MRYGRAIVGLAGVVLLLFVTAGRPAGQGSSNAVVIPHESWTCGLPAGIPPPEGGTLVFQAEMNLDRMIDVGQTQYGRRRVAVVRDGTLSGPRLSGSVMTGALDFELTLANGVVELEQILVLRTSDGGYVYVRAAGTGPDATDVRLVMDFEAPIASEAAGSTRGRTSRGGCSTRRLER